MINPHWLLPTMRVNQNHTRVKMRKIFNIKSGVHLDRYLQEMRRSGVHPIRYLSHLGMMIGEYVSPTSSYGIERHPDIEHMEADIRITINEPYIGDVTMIQQQTLPWGIEQIQAPKAWSYSRGNGVRVAVIDTGIAGEHPAVRDNYRGGINILSPYYAPKDYNGHGTHVAGIIAGRDADLGLTGVSPRTHIYAVKAFNRKGSANLSDLLSAINWCIDNNMQVINMSFGMEKLSESLRQAIQIAYQKKIIMIAATGNRGFTSKIDFPARYNETIGVSSISKEGKLSTFSNMGQGFDIAAPGDKIPSAWLNNTKRDMSGTSMAVPHVSGTVALLLYLNRNLSPENMRHLLKKSSKSLQKQNRIPTLNAYQAVQLYDKSYR
ncbi:S8 family peptidase [Hazenella sp. IB182357]|uniref:S8 family peptidase n=1 Tax=Polycladospora coralii TaxID=2771432 RepID=A0A926N867_9BACL|nr:S8 family peptidase [Polycladospora coralii]MBD1371022.1 S8 family peptidase [Polycladospora coralii]